MKVQWQVKALRQINTPPDGFPKASVEEIANVLCALPSGTAEGCRTPLEYARLRLASIRREYMAKECADSLNPFARGSELDQKFANLYTAVGTALDEYRALAALPAEEPETPEPTVAARENDKLAAQGLDIGEKTRQAYEDGAKTIGDIARPESTRADDLKRQMKDAAGLTRLSRNELSLPGVVVGWYRRAIAKLAEYPRIIQKTVSGIRKATDIAEKCWDVWDRFQSKGVKLIFEVTREFLEIAHKFADDLEKTGTGDSDIAAPQAPGKAPPEPPPDFNIQEAREMILAGRAPPESWRPWIHELSFIDSDLVDLAPLAGLTALQSLDLRGTKVADLAPLARLAALQSLDLRGTQVADLAPLAGLTALQVLHLGVTPVADLAPLAGLTALQQLFLGGTNVADLAPLTRLTALQWLGLWQTPVADLAPLARLTALQSLDLENTQVADLAPLARLAALRSLRLWNTKVADLAPLAGLTALQALDLAGMKVADLAPLAGLTALQVLDLTSTQVADLAPLAGLAALRSLRIWNTQVAELTPLAGLTTLQSLDLTGTKVADLAPLAGLTALQTLKLGKTRVADLAPLKDLPRLREIRVENQQRGATLERTLGKTGIVRFPE
jgi:Leucine-rich repeat (LRR) protein